MLLLLSWAMWPMGFFVESKLDVETTYNVFKKEKKKEKVSKLTYPTLHYCLRMLHIMHTTIMKGGIGQSGILPRLLQRSKECRGHYSTLYHATSQWIIRSYTHLSFWHNVKKSVHLKFKIMSITCRFHISDVVLPCIFRTKM